MSRPTSASSAPPAPSPGAVPRRAGRAGAGRRRPVPGRGALRRRNWERFPFRRPAFRRGRAHPRPPRPLRLPAAARPRGLPRSRGLHREHRRPGRDRAARQRTPPGGGRRLRQRGGWSKHRPALPLYDSGDVEAGPAPVRPVDFATGSPDRRGVDACDRPGTSSGRPSRLRLRRAPRGASAATSVAPATPSCGRLPLRRRSASLVVESTYGDRRHAGRTRSGSPAPYADGRPGRVVLIPAFAVDRTELVLLELRRLGARRIPRRAGLRRQPDGAGRARCLPRGGPTARAATPGPRAPGALDAWTSTPSATRAQSSS